MNNERERAQATELMRWAAHRYNPDWSMQYLRTKSYRWLYWRNVYEVVKWTMLDSATRWYCRWYAFSWRVRIWFRPEALEELQRKHGCSNDDSR
jgi:hypothetical protein